MRTKQKKMKSSTLIALLVIAAMLFAIGSTLAYLADRTARMENVFVPSEVKTEIGETFDGNVKENVVIKNTGDIDAYIRAEVVVTWEKADGTVLGEKPVSGTDYSMTQTLTDWTEIKGVYYYKNKVASKGVTEELIDSCKPLKAAPVEGYTLHVEILAEAIQAEPDTAIKEAWGIDPQNWVEVK